MLQRIHFILIINIGMIFLGHFKCFPQIANSEIYLDEVKNELNKKWPQNRAINLVFHGHSVPAGYWHNSEVHTLDSYPHIVLEKIKEKYPFAVVNIIITAKGGENSINGSKRIESDVLNLKPDILFIDYSLNDVSQNMEDTRIAWSLMINKALKQQVKIILITPSPDQRENILNQNNRLVIHARQVESLSKEFQIGLANVMPLFQQISHKNGTLIEVMSHVNHPNRLGHEIIAKEIFKWF